MGLVNPCPAGQKLAENTEGGDYNYQQEYQSQWSERLALHGIDAAVNKFVYLFLVFRVKTIAKAAILLVGEFVAHRRHCTRLRRGELALPFSPS